MVAKRYGMRGRLWWLWSCQTIGGVLCIGLGLANNSFSSTMVVLCFFSFFVQVRHFDARRLPDASQQSSLQQFASFGASIHARTRPLSGDQYPVPCVDPFNPPTHPVEQ